MNNILIAILEIIMIVIVSLVLTANGFSCKTWQWWVVMICMILYRLLGMARYA